MWVFYTRNMTWHNTVRQQRNPYSPSCTPGYSYLYTFPDWLFPMDMFLVHSLLQGVNGAQWKLLGINLSIPWNKLDAIENEASFPGDIAKKEEVIRLWMSKKPTWIMLVEALSQPSIGLSQKASQISQEHSKYLTIIIAIYAYTAYSCV